MHPLRSLQIPERIHQMKQCPPKLVTMLKTKQSNKTNKNQTTTKKQQKHISLSLVNDTMLYLERQKQGQQADRIDKRGRSICAKATTQYELVMVFEFETNAFNKEQKHHSKEKKRLFYFYNQCVIINNKSSAITSLLSTLDLMPLTVHRQCIRLARELHVYQHTW